MSLFGKKNWVGLEINDGNIKIIEVSEQKGRLRLVAWGKMKLPPGAVRDGEILDDELVGRSLGKLRESVGISTRDVITGVSNKGVFVRFAEFPPLPPDKLKNMIKFQAQDYLPVDLDSLVFDYSVTYQRRDGDQPATDVLLVGADRGMLDALISALDIAGLKPIEIEASVLSLLRYMGGKPGQDALVHVNLAEGIGNIVIAERGVPRLARMVPAGDFSEMESCCELLAENVVSSVGYYQTLPEAKNIDRILISGPKNNMGQLYDALQERLGIEVSLLKPLDSININLKKAQNFVDEALDYALCLSLAKRGLEG